jgi:quercetin dioxygenase-like cupin family protein
VADVTVKRLGEFEATYNGAFHLIRAGLGVSSFGMQVIEMPANADQYPEHDHSEDGMEEVYTAIDGSAILSCNGEEFTLEPGVFARVAPGQKRHLRTEDSPVRILAIGGVPGKVYEISPLTEEGQGSA